MATDTNLSRTHDRLADFLGCVAQIGQMADGDRLPVASPLIVGEVAFDAEVVLPRDREKLGDVVRNQGGRLAMGAGHDGFVPRIALFLIDTVKFLLQAEYNIPGGLQMRRELRVFVGVNFFQLFSGQTHRFTQVGSM